jgi:hypothetical protein
VTGVTVQTTKGLLLANDAESQAEHSVKRHLVYDTNRVKRGEHHHGLHLVVPKLGPAFSRAVLTRHHRKMQDWTHFLQ